VNLTMKLPVHHIPDLCQSYGLHFSESGELIMLYLRKEQRSIPFAG
jgi:hypothetical protein